MMGQDVIPRNDGAGYDIVDATQKRIGWQHDSTMKVYDEAVISYKDMCKMAK
jgi:hypothetical protein